MTKPSAKTGRPSKWSGPTRAIRVPERLAGHLLDIARQLDNPEPTHNDQPPSGLPVCKPKADAETIAQGLAEGWIVPCAAPPEPAPGPYLVTLEEGGEVEQYLVPQVGPLTRGELEVIDDLVLRVEAALQKWTPSEQALIFSGLVREYGQKL